MSWLSYTMYKSSACPVPRLDAKIQQLSDDGDVEISRDERAWPREPKSAQEVHFWFHWNPKVFVELRKHRLRTASMVLAQARATITITILTVDGGGYFTICHTFLKFFIICHTDLWQIMKVKSKVWQIVKSPGWWGTGRMQTHDVMHKEQQYLEIRDLRSIWTSKILETKQCISY